MSEGRRMLVVGVIVALVFVAVGSVWLSVSAETLDEVAEQFSVKDIALWIPPIPGYEIPGFEGVISLNILVGAVSTVVVLGVTLVVGKILRAKKRSDHPI